MKQRRCQAEKYEAMDYTRCEAEGSPHRIEGLLLAVQADLCEKHVKYFASCGYFVERVAKGKRKAAKR